MFILSSSDAWQLEFTTYLVPLKNCCPKQSHKFICQYWPKTEQPEQPTGKCCQKTNFKKTNGIVTNLVMTNIELNQRTDDTLKF